MGTSLVSLGTQTDQSDIPNHRTSCSVYKAGERRRKRKSIWSDGVCIPKYLLLVMGPCPPRDA